MVLGLQVASKAFIDYLWCRTW